MSFIINDFISNLTNNNDTARVAHFDVYIAIPPILQNGGILNKLIQQIPGAQPLFNQIVASIPGVSIQNGKAAAINGAINALGARSLIGTVPGTGSLINGGMTSYQLSLQAETSELPGRDLEVIEYRFNNFIKRIPHFNTYGRITFNFICTGTLAEKMFFDQWMDFMLPTQTGLVSYPWDTVGNHQYDTTVNINQYDQAGNLVYTVKLIEALPISIAPMQQNWGTDSIHRLQVTFAFTNWSSSSTPYNMTTDFSLPSSIYNPTATAGTQQPNVNNFSNNNLPVGHVIAPGVGWVPPNQIE